MIGRHGLIAGVFALVLFLSLYLAYAVVSGWDVPIWLVAILGMLVFFGSAIATDHLIGALEQQAELEGESGG